MVTMGTNTSAGTSGRAPSTTKPGVFRSYDPKEELPLGGYAALVAAYAAGAGTLLVLGRDRLPKRVPLRDLVLIGIATHKLTRIATKDWVTAPFRAPFTRYESSAGGGEVKETSRGKGLQRAIGDLVTCPWCSGPWIAGSLVAGYVAAPRLVRIVAATFAAVAISDFLHHAYGRVKGS